MIKLGFVSAILADLPFEEVVSFASENRFACVEMMCWPVGKAERRYAGVTHIDANDLSPERINSVQDLLTEKGISVSALGYYPNPLEADREQAAFFVAAHQKSYLGVRPTGHRCHEHVYRTESSKKY